MRIKSYDQVHKHLAIISTSTVSYHYLLLRILSIGNSLAVQWLGLHASTAGDKGSIPSQGTKILHAFSHDQINK